MSTDQIVDAVQIWLTRVEAVVGKKPIIYTNAHWWSERLGSDKRLAKYDLWISDYGSKSRGREAPNVPDGFRWMFWQLTDKGALERGGISNTVDTNVFRGARSEFDGVIRK